MRLPFVLAAISLAGMGMRKRSIRVLSVLWFAACVSMSSQAQGEYIRPIEADCAEVSFPLSYLSYGVATPPQQEGWRCTALISPSLPPPNSSVTWKKSGKRIKLSDLTFDEMAPDDFLRQKNKQEPEATIRYFVELFFKDENVLKKDESLKYDREIHANSINGIAWSKNNERAIAYIFDEGNKENNEEEQANAFIFKKGQDKEFLVVGCWGCSLQEFFSLIIEPVIHN
jgi:hypothetical protein